MVGIECAEDLRRDIRRRIRARLARSRTTMVMVMVMPGMLRLGNVGSQLLFRNTGGTRRSIGVLVQRGGQNGGGTRRSTGVLVQRGEQSIGLSLCSALAFDVVLHFCLAHHAVAVSIHSRE